MKLTARLLFCLSLIGMFVLAGCGDEQVLEQVQKDRENMTAMVDQAAGDLNSSLEKLKSENNNLRIAIEVQSRQIEDLSFQIRKLQEAAGVAKQQIEREKAEAEAGKGFKFWQYLVIIIVVIIVIVILWRLLRPRPFEEDEDEDFSSFDDDFGFDDEDELLDDEDDKAADDEDDGEKKS
ncbi:MAG: hypothetical protein PWP23_884 [Candidatus Sumerlaeota bacterium]|nr:hypothetical protein [Candidatus Sumerlaeota bacterium]